MSPVGVVPSCLLAVLLSGGACCGQSGNTFAPAPTAAIAPNPASAVVSVHDLQIPERARKACEKGTKLFAAKDPAGSIPDFQKAIKAFPGYYEAYAKLGAAELDLEQWGEAEAAFRKAIDLSGGHYAPADFGLGLILATVTKNFADAEAIVRAGLETSRPMLPATLCWRGCSIQPPAFRKPKKMCARLSRPTRTAPQGYCWRRFIFARLISQLWWTTSIPIWPWALLAR